MGAEGYVAPKFFKISLKCVKLPLIFPICAIYNTYTFTSHQKNSPPKRKKLFPTLMYPFHQFAHRQGYLTENGVVNLSRVQLMMTDLGDMEDSIFKKRRSTELGFRQRAKDKKRRMGGVSLRYARCIICEMH